MQIIMIKRIVNLSLIALTSFKYKSMRVVRNRIIPKSLNFTEAT